MRHFVVLGHEAPLEPDFSLDDLAGGAGRLDVLCRCVNAAMFLSHGIREAVRVYLVLQDTATVEIASDELQYMAPDERNIAGIIRNALSARSDVVGHQAVKASPGVQIANHDLATTLDRIDASLYWLQESGTPLPNITPPDDAGFIVSDHQDFSDHDHEVISEHTEQSVNVSPNRLHADHVITIMQNYLDTAGYTRYT